MRQARQVLTSGVGTIAVVVISDLLLAYARSGPVRLAIALSSLPFLVWFIYAEIAYLRRADEFHRRVVLESFAISFPVAIFIGVAVDAIQKAGFLARTGIGDVWPYMALTFVPSLILIYRHYDRGE